MKKETYSISPIMANCSHIGFQTISVLWMERFLSEALSIWAVFTLSILERFKAVYSKRSESVDALRWTQFFDYLIECKKAGISPDVLVDTHIKWIRYWTPEGVELASISVRDWKSRGSTALDFAKVWGLKPLNMYYGPEDGIDNGDPDQDLFWQIAPIPDDCDRKKAQTVVSIASDIMLDLKSWVDLSVLSGNAASARSYIEWVLSEGRLPAKYQQNPIIKKIRG